MVKNKTDESKKIRQQAGLTIIVVCMIVLAFVLSGFFIKFSSIDVNNDISSEELKAEILNVDDIDTDVVFANTYYKALNILSTTVGHGTTWLEICPDSQETYNDLIYFKTCSSEYNSVSDLKNYLSSILTNDYIEEFISDSYIDRDGDLYITPMVSEINKDYIEMASYTVKSVTSNKIIYMVKSKYATLGCTDCDYTYKEHKFILEYTNGEWLVSNMEMPY